VRPQTQTHEHPLAWNRNRNYPFPSIVSQANPCNVSAPMSQMPQMIWIERFKLDFNPHKILAPKEGLLFSIWHTSGQVQQDWNCVGDLAEETHCLLQGFLLLLHEHPTVIFTKHVAGENTNRQAVDSQTSKCVKWWNFNSSPETKPHLVRICSSKIIPCPLEVLLRVILLSDNPKRAISC
jgi:hypothetical protein